MKKAAIFLTAISIITGTISVNAASVLRESLLCYATTEQVTVAENLIGGILDEVKNGLGYADARAKSNVIIFNAWLNGQTGGYAYGELTPIANNAIYQYRDMYLRPIFYIENEKKVRDIIADVILQYANGEIGYTKAKFNARVKIY